MFFHSQDLETATNSQPRNLKYTNPALRANQTFPAFPISSSVPTPPSSPASTNQEHFDLSSATSLHPIFLPEAAQQPILLYTKTQKLSISANHPQGFMNRTSWISQSIPLLSLPRSAWDENQLIPHISSGTWVDLIINNLDDGSHPFHLHGYSFYVLATHRSENGWGSYNPFATKGASAAKPVINLRNPVKKDTVSVPRRGYVIIRFKADNEGIWMLHCHILFHQGSGMAMGIHVGVDEGHEDFELGAKKLCELA
jgi:FtsP/CotA-like multicopper oxidase with cupredoxin domain